MKAFDVYGKTDQLEPALLDAIAARLEARASHPFFRRMMHEYLEAMNIDAAGRVVDLGCGTGVAAREIAGRDAFSGTVLGIDLSSHLVEMARRLGEQENKGQRLDFQAGDTRKLSLPGSGFDAVIAHTLISHVDDPVAVLKEAARLVKPGGLIGIFDGDYASLTFSHEDPDESRRYDEAIQRALITQPRVMRLMPRLLREAGLELVTSFSYVLAEAGRAEFWVPAVESFRKLIPAAGVMTPEEINSWVDARLRESEENIFFGASNFYSYIAKRS
ncbi:MAG TPA: methyltransferase domain-containing protein [Arenicellales bacterium]|nr:methyltransferase domain-containing protein [Arenicellales bacterium]